MSENPTFTDVQRREIFTEIVSRDGVKALSIERSIPGGSSTRLMLLNRLDAQQLFHVIEHYLKEVYAGELAGGEIELSPEDMLKLFGEEEL